LLPTIETTIGAVIPNRDFNWLTIACSLLSGADVAFARSAASAPGAKDHTSHASTASAEIDERRQLQRMEDPVLSFLTSVRITTCPGRALAGGGVNRNYRHNHGNTRDAQMCFELLLNKEKMVGKFFEVKALHYQELAGDHVFPVFTQAFTSMRAVMPRERSVQAEIV
jgi:hypothetical protein